MAGADPRPHLFRAERSIHINVEPPVGHQELLPVEFLDGKALSPADRIILRQDGIHRVVIQRRPIAVDAALPCGKDDVGAPRLQQLERLKLMVHHAQVDIRVRAHPPEAVKDLRHPVHRDARIRGNADRRRPLFRDGLDLILQPCRRAEIFPYGGQQRFSVLGQRDAAVVAPDERHADLALQPVDQVRQSRLGVAHHLRRFGKAAEVDCRHQYFKLLAVHGSAASCPSGYFNL